MTDDLSPRAARTAAPVVLDLPFRGRWLARNSPARRVPSHGTHLFGTTYAIDFLAVDERGRSARITWRTAVATEAPERFVGFGADILAPAAGHVVTALDVVADHAARRSPLTLLPYALGQAGRARAGGTALAGNHVVIASGDRFVLLAHLQHGSVRVRAGDHVASGDPIGRCGNSGNSTQPHVHVQVTDAADQAQAVGVPMLFRRPGDAGAWMPAEGEIVDAR